MVMGGEIRSQQSLNFSLDDELALDSFHDLPLCCRSPVDRPRLDKTIQDRDPKDWVTDLWNRYQHRTRDVLQPLNVRRWAVKLSFYYRLPRGHHGVHGV